MAPSFGMGAPALYAQDMDDGFHGVTPQRIVTICTPDDLLWGEVGVFDEVEVIDMDVSDRATPLFMLHFHRVASHRYAPRPRGGLARWRDAVMRLRRDAQADIEVFADVPDAIAWLEETPAAASLEDVRLVQLHGSHDELAGCADLGSDCRVEFQRDGSVMGWWVRLAYVWGIDREKRNRLMHALNGNTVCKTCGVACTGALCDSCGLALFGISAAEASRQAKEAAQATVIKTPACRMCSATFNFTKHMASKIANHKSKAHYYGFDLCEPCRAAQQTVVADPDADSMPAMAADAPSAPPLPKAALVPIGPRARREGAPEPKEDRSVHFEEAPTEVSEFKRLKAFGEGLVGSGTFHILRCGFLRHGDYVLAREFCEPHHDDAVLKHAFGEARYYRVGHKLQDVVVGGVRSPAHDWFFDPVPISLQREGPGVRAGYKQVRACILERSQVAGHALVLLRIERTTQDRMAARHRFLRVVYKRRVYTAFRGSTISEITIDGQRRYVPSQVLGEVLRYFSNEANGKTSASHIMGQLKLNGALAAEDIDFIVRFACAYHDSRAVGYAEAVSGDLETRRLVDTEMAGRRDVWWLPDFFHFRSQAPLTGNNWVQRWMAILFVVALGFLCLNFVVSGGAAVFTHRAHIAERVGTYWFVLGSLNWVDPNLVRDFSVEYSNDTWWYIPRCENGSIKGHDCSHMRLSAAEMSLFYMYENRGLANCSREYVNEDTGQNYNGPKFERRYKTDDPVWYVNVSVPYYDEEEGKVKYEIHRVHPCQIGKGAEQQLRQSYEKYGTIIKASEPEYKWAWLEWYRSFFNAAFESGRVARFFTHAAYTLGHGPMHVMYIAPLWEEAAKRLSIPTPRGWLRLGGYVTVAIIYMEYWSMWYQNFMAALGVFLNAGLPMLNGAVLAFGIATMSSMRYHPTAFMHRYCAEQPYLIGVLLHSFWNHIALGFQGVCDGWYWFIVLVLAPGAQMLTAFGFMAWLRLVYGVTATRFTAGSLGFGGVLSSLGLAAAVKSYNAGHSDRFPRVAPAGVDSEFVDLMKDPEFEKKFPIKDGAEFDVRKRWCKPTTNRLTQLMPCFAPGVSFARNTANASHSVAGRVLKKTPDVIRPTDGIVKLLDEMSNKMGHVPADSFEDWAAKFPPAKRNRYGLAFLRIATFGFAMFSDELLGARNGWAKRSCFLKHEVNLSQADKEVTTATRKYRIASSDPRTIQASTDEVQALLGRYFTAYGRRASECFDGSESSTVGGWRVGVAFGRTKVEVSAIVKRICDSGEKGIVDCGDDVLLIMKGVIYALDAARWDAHVTRALLKLKSRHLRRLGMPQHHVELMERMINRKGSFKHLGVSFSVDGDVASGDPDTLYWNTLLGICVIIDSARCDRTLEEMKKSAVEVGIEYDCAGESLTGELGPKVDFCSCVFTPSAGGKVLAPKLGRSMFKLSFTATTGNPAKLLASKILGLCYDLCCFPFVVANLRRLLATLPNGVAVSESFVPMGKVEPASDAELDTFFSERYGHSKAEVEAEVVEWTNRALVGEMRAGDLHVLRKLVEVDYGKAPLAAPCRNSWLRPAFMLFLFCVAADGGQIQGRGLPRRWAGGPEFSIITSISPANTELSTLTTIMNGKKKGNNKGRATIGPVKKGGGKKGGGGRAPRVSGSGLYKLLGPMAKLAVKAALPGALGNAAQQLMPNVSRIQGSGDYVTNDIVHASTSAMKSNGGGKGVPVFKYQHSEYIKDLVVPAVPTAFSTQRFTLNAADAETFPWLSRLASLYTKYRFTKLLFEFRTNTSNYSAAGGLGTVVMAPHYNVDALTFTSKQLMEAATHAVSAAPSSSVMMGFECDKRDSNVTWFNVLNDNTMTRSPFTDAGAVEIATNGLPGTPGVSLGELWVHYSCDLIEPYISVTDAITTGPTALAAGWYTASSNLADPWANGFLGLQYGSMTALGASSFPGAIYQAATISTGPPTGNNWFAYCAGDAGNKSLGFRLAGTYAIEWSCRLSAATTLANGAPFDLAASSGTLVSVTGNNSATNEFVWATAGSAWVSYRWVVTVAANTSLISTKNTGWTGTATLTQPSTSLVVYKLG